MRGAGSQSVPTAVPTEGQRSMYGGIFARLTQARPSLQPTNAMNTEEIDRRCQLVLSEIDRCKNFEEEYIESSVLHSVPQTFVPSELHAELCAELDRLLTEQILREERQLQATSNATPSSHASITSQLDSDECLACKSRCKWTPFCDANSLARRRKLLYRELKSAERQEDAKTIQSVVARSALNKGEIIFVRKELMKELSDEIQQIDSKLKLAQIDSELHQTYASRNESVSVRSIHGYDTTVKRRDAIWALEHEHNRHIAQIVAVETIDNILEWMLEGWYFGERDTKDKVRFAELPSFDQRGSLMDKASSVQWDSNMNAKHDAQAKAMQSANEDCFETNMKYGLFCLTFMYFRALHVLRKEKAVWDGSNDLVSLRNGPPLSEERKKMIQEAKNAEFRRNRIEYAMRKARVGEERKRQRSEKELREKAKLREWDNKKKQWEQRLAITVQRVFRGHLGRNVARMRARELDRADFTEALENACATDIARAWRGYCGRLDAGYLRAEMAKFLFAIREEEVRDEEKEFDLIGR